MMHNKIAEAIVADIHAGSGIFVVADHRPSRQGDVVAVRVGEANLDKTGAMELPGKCVAAGARGEHHLIGDKATILDRGDGVVSLPNGGYLVHTDSVEDRHGAIYFPSGEYKFSELRELTADAVVQKVED